MAGWSLVSRLIWSLIGTLAVLWLLGGVAVALLTSFEVNERLDNALEEVGQRLMPATADVSRESQAMQTMANQLVPTMDPKALAYQIVGTDGRVALRSENAPDAAFVLPLQTGFRDIAHYRVYTQRSNIGAYFVEVAEPTMHRREALGRAMFLSVAPLLVFLPLSWLLIRFIVRRGTRSLIHLQQEIGERDGTNLVRIPQLPMPRELVPIHTAVNRLLDRIERALANERQFAANSAHELRTPIAAILAQVQVLSAQLVGTPNAERASLIVRQVKSLGALTEKLLQLSRTGASLTLRREQIDLMPVLRMLIDDFRRQDGVGTRLRFTTGSANAFIVLADIDALGIAIRNLLENAVLYGARNEAIDVVIDDATCLRIRNGYGVISPDELATLRKPFQRGTTIGQGGGLGLAIVDSVMSQLGGALHLSSPAKNCRDGFEATLVFPAAPVA